MNGEMRICSRCGQTKPIDQFDARFIHKGTRLTCAQCRGVHDERAQALYVSWRAEQQPIQREWHQREERRAAVEARLQRYDNELQSQLVPANRRNHLRMQAWRIGRRTSERWEDIKRCFDALDPPFTLAERPKRRPSSALKQTLFTKQRGLCYYCGIEMAPLDMPYQGSAEYRAARRAQEALFLEAVMTETPGSDARATAYDSWHDSPEYARFRQLDEAWRPLSQRRANLEHIVPLTRGGADSTENLALTCNACNIRKSVRTPTEFLQMPDDQVSRLIDLCHMQLGDLARAIQYERENLYGFAHLCAELRILNSI